MSLTNLQRQWQHAADERRLKVQIPFVADLGDGQRVAAQVLLEGYGASRGMLIVSDFASIEKSADAIVSAGYGFSCMSEPDEAQIPSLARIEAALKDWDTTTANEKPA